jgi:hypothetical protein
LCWATIPLELRRAFQTACKCRGEALQNIHGWFKISRQEPVHFTAKNAESTKEAA